MAHLPFLKKSQKGSSMMEVLVAIFVVAVGLLGAAGMQMLAARSGVEAQQRAQAMGLLKSMSDRISAQPGLAECYVTTTETDGTPYLGVEDAGYVAPALNCTGGTSQTDVALINLQEWNSALQGAAELSGSGASVGAMQGARGCVARTADTVNDMFVYTVAVAWQGQDDLFVIPNASDNPALACGTDLYGAEARRRVLFTTLRVANLNN